MVKLEVDPRVAAILAEQARKIVIEAHTKALEDIKSCNDQILNSLEDKDEHKNC
jgi:hypothetical protein